MAGSYELTFWLPGVTNSVRSLFFRDLSRGLPAFADWFGRQPGSVVRYQFKEISFQGDDDESEP